MEISKMKTVARLITTEVCPHCSPTSMLSCQVFASSCHLWEIHLHQCIPYHNPSPIKPTRARQARLLLPRETL